MPLPALQVINDPPFFIFTNHASSGRKPAVRDATQNELPQLEVDEAAKMATTHQRGGPADRLAGVGLRQVEKTNA